MKGEKVFATVLLANEQTDISLPVRYYPHFRTYITVRKFSKVLMNSMNGSRKIWLVLQP